ncbi:MAG: hypothetical protein H0V81_01230 [Solirubrobacterales bacterium]|nr:hypothetical protein [Solirubrobacterales bacterium]
MRQAPSVTAFRALLGGLGGAMVVASHTSARFRRQVTRDVTIEVSCDDGACQAYVFSAKTRTMRLARVADGEPHCAIRFDTAAIGLRSLLSRRAVGRIVEGWQYGGARIEGKPTFAVWFHGLTRIVAPIGPSRLPRRPIPIPDRSVEQSAPWAQRVVREPPLVELPREQQDAWRARAKLLQVRVPGGEPLPPG